MGKWNILFQNWICLLLRSINLPCPTVMLSCPQNCVERKVGRSKNKLLHLCIMALSASKCISWFVISPTKRYVSLSGVKDRTSAQSMSLKDKYILKSQKVHFLPSSLFLLSQASCFDGKTKKPSGLIVYSRRFTGPPFFFNCY